MQIRNNLYIAYYVLLSITFVCSCLLLVAAAENIAASSLQQPGNVDNLMKDFARDTSEPVPTKLSIDAQSLGSVPTTTLHPNNQLPKADVTADALEHEMANTESQKPQNTKPNVAFVPSHKNSEEISGNTANMITDTGANEENHATQTDSTESDEQQIDEKNGDKSSLHILNNNSLTDLRELMPDNVVAEIPPTTVESPTTPMPPNVNLHSNDYENNNFSTPAPMLDIENDESIDSSKSEEQRGQRNVVNSEDGANSLEPINRNDSDTALNATFASATVHNISVGVGQDVNSSEEIAAASANAEEVPIPVFSEWAQKQMEEEKAMEQKVYNTKVYKKNQTNDGNGKVQPLKIRAKNYASPDCGAKIIASNTDATNTGAVLSSSKDEYMLSPCGNRIWFVVELCEAIQARKIDVANFELFSSSPRNFTVAVSNRFPTRDWSNVGRFIAADKRTIQSFELHPHLFGKFIRVDIHSHYSKEHFCPVSLFRVFGTSEFEAFETENHPTGSDDDIDDDFDEEHSDHAKKSESNLFKSASDAVLSIVKKAAEVLVKPTVAEYNNSLSTQHVNNTRMCCTPVFEYFRCATCPQSLVDQVNRILSCELSVLMHLLHVPQIRKDLLRTRICTERYGLDIAINDCNEGNKLESENYHSSAFGIHTYHKQSYYLNLLPAGYVGGLCQLLYVDQFHVNREPNGVGINAVQDVELNLTIGKKPVAEDAFQINDKIEKDMKIDLTTSSSLKRSKLSTGDDNKASSSETVPVSKIPTPIENEPVSGEHENAYNDENSTEPTTTVSDDEVHENSATIHETLPVTEPVEQTETFEKVTAPDINIFNAPPPTIEIEKVNEEDNGSGLASKESYVTEGANLIDELLDSSVNSGDSSAPLDESKTGSKSDNEDDDKWTNLDQFLMQPTAKATPNSGLEDNSAPLGSNNNNNVDGIMDNGGSNSNYQQKGNSPTGPQSESVFIRLSNRIKALERNMSLSGQYLEELSRRYKKQVEELQLTLTQQSQSVRLLEEQGRQHIELERLLAQRNAQLKDELDDLTLQVHACIVLIIFVGAFVFIVLMVGILFYRSMRRETKEVLSTLVKRVHGDKQRGLPMGVTVGDTNQKLCRRKSFEDLPSDHLRHQISPEINSKKQRRPSEEAMLILKDCNDPDRQVTAPSDDFDVISQCKRQENMALSYGNGPLKNSNSKVIAGDKRRNKKYSWPQTAEQRQQQQMVSWHLQQEAQHYDRLIRNEAAVMRKWNGVQNEQPQPCENQKKKRKSNNLKRQESAPSKYPAAVIDERLNASAPVEILDSTLLLDGEDINNFIPTADLAYNEFMPDGPFNYKLETAVNKSTELSKSRRLTSVIFRTPFSKNLKTKMTTASSATTTKVNPPHESTSWEWYRLNKSHAPVNKMPTNNNKPHTLAFPSTGHEQLPGMSPSDSVDSTSLSEINFPNNYTENSFRMLEEAIISSGETTGVYTATSAATTAAASAAIRKNDGHNSSNSHSSGSGSGGSSNRSSSSSTSVNATKTKKTYRSFNRIFRKVF